QYDPDLAVVSRALRIADQGQGQQGIDATIIYSVELQEKSTVRTFYCITPEAILKLSTKHGSSLELKGPYVREHHQQGSPEVEEPAKLECTKRAAHRSLDSEGLQEMQICFESWSDASSMFDRLAEALSAYSARHATVT
ncbi:hypothetical protein FOZ61_002710, partial [Perkinsus olseni]